MNTHKYSSNPFNLTNKETINLFNIGLLSETQKSFYEGAMPKANLKLIGNTLCPSDPSDKIWTEEILPEVKNPNPNGDQGEYDCINLCLTIESREEIQDDYKLLMDDKIGRKIAEQNDISVISSIGVLRASIRKGILKDYNEITSIINKLSYEINHNNLRIPENLLVAELTQAMERKNIKQKEKIEYSYGRSLK